VNVAEAPVLPKKLAVCEEMVAFSAIRRSPVLDADEGKPVTAPESLPNQALSRDSKAPSGVHVPAQPGP
jgi:hypothetical protein